MAERPRARPAIAPATATGAACGAWRATEAPPHARAASPSEVRSRSVVEVSTAPPIARAPVAPRAPQPTMVFDYAIDAPN